MPLVLTRLRVQPETDIAKWHMARGRFLAKFNSPAGHSWHAEKWSQYKISPPPCTAPLSGTTVSCAPTKSVLPAHCPPTGSTAAETAF